MLVDLRLAELQAEYKREQLARSYANANRRKRVLDGAETVLDGDSAWLPLFARLLMLNR